MNRSVNSSLVPRRYEVIRNQPETHDTATLTLGSVDEAVPAPDPGQFTMLTVLGVGDVPVSVSAAPGPNATGAPRDGRRLVQTVRSVGAVTNALYEATPGRIVGVRGPFGVGWDLAAARGRDVIIMAGGLGFAPLRPVVHAVIAERKVYGQVAVLVGARTPGDLLYLDELERMADAYTAVTVDRPTDGWLGSVGVVTTLLAGTSFDPVNTVAYVCGPEVMMWFTADALVRRSVPADRIQVSLERNMHCGAGLCGHCQVGPLLVCRDGPVVVYDRVAPLLTVREL